MKVFKNAWFTRYAKKQKIKDKTLLEAIARAEKGLIDADLGSGIIKQRIPRNGQGKSGGYRTIILYKSGNKAFFVYGFSKNDMDNISKDEEFEFKRMARIILNLNDIQMEELIANGHMMEITDE